MARCCGSAGSRGSFGRCCVAAVAAAIFAATSAAATGPGDSALPAAPEQGDGEKFNCGQNWWEAVTAFLGGDWPEEKKEWCCKHRKVGCESRSAAAEVKYDCQEGYEVRDQTWSEEKSTWCCDHERLGCKTDAWNAEPFDCRAGLSRWQEEWSGAKKAWCCEFEGKGCQLPTTATTTEPFDCISDLLQWDTRWSQPRRSYCCRRHGRGCSSTSTRESPEEYDCKDGLADWEKLWSRRKQAWCCEGRARCERRSTTDEPGTTTVATTTGELFDCRLRAGEGTDKWTGWKKEWCCDRHDVGCESTTVTTTLTKPYDCLQDAATWKESWPADKKRWCCKHELRGCTDCDVACVVAGFPASCRNRIEWLELHDLHNKANSCTRARHIVIEECPACGRCDIVDACPVVAELPQKYDCTAGRADAQRKWSREKKDWCCHYYDEGCPPTTTTTTTITTTPEPYNCVDGASNLKAEWSEKQRAWCCTHHGAGCTACDTSCVIDGLSATCRDRVGWLLGHVMRNQEDACTHAHGLVLDQCASCGSCAVVDACPSEEVATTTTTLEPFDCQVGLTNWRLGWSKAKLDWCCRHTNIGCREVAQRDEAAADEYDCQVGLSAWSYEKTDWCCKHKQLGCSLMVTTAAPASTVDQEPYDCQRDVLDWAELWPLEKQDWCCSRYSLGCRQGTAAGGRAPQVTSSLATPQWVARDTLPDVEGETLSGYSASMGSLGAMKQWCEDHPECVGFAMQPETLRWYPKKVGTGFDAGTAAWSADKWRGEAWRWYYLQDRGLGTPLAEVGVKFEQPVLTRRFAQGAARERRRAASPMIEEAAKLAAVGCAALAAAALVAARAFGAACRRSCEAPEGRDAATYLSLLPSIGEPRSPESDAPTLE